MITPDEIRAIRKGKGMSRSAFAQALLVSPRTVESWEQGRKTPWVHTERAIRDMDGRHVAPETEGT